jgi:hypothetical protein
VRAAEPARPFGRPGPPSVLGNAPVARRALSKPEQAAAAASLPLQREALWRPSALRYWERTLYPVLRAVGGYSLWAQQSRNADAVWRSVEEQATQDAWFENLGLRRTFMTEHALLVLHTWLVHKRFTLDRQGRGELDGRRADEELFGRLWSDTERRIRNAGVTMSVNKQLALVQKASFVDMFEYDLGLKQEDDNLELAAALFRGVFRADDNANVEDVILLADWVRREVANVLTQPAEDVYHGWITWSPVLGETRAERLARQKALFQGEWREAFFVDGAMYWYNTRTSAVSRDPLPPDGLYRRRRFALAHYLHRLERAGKIPPGIANPDNLRSFAPDAAGDLAQDDAFRVVLPGGADRPRIAAAADDSAASAPSLHL